jgi:hypothetical protein
MKTRLIPLAVLALLIAGATITAFAVGGSGATAKDGELPTRAESIGIPDECNMVRSIDGCDVQALYPAVPLDDSACEPVPLRSDCGIDPDECNMIHNITACDPAVVPVEQCIQYFDPTGPVGEPSCEPIPQLTDGGNVTDGCAFDACPDDQIVLDPPGPGPVIDLACAPSHPDCVDTLVEPSCEPVPPRSDGGIVTGGCETLPPVDGEVLPPVEGDRPATGFAAYEMTIVFNATVTQDHLDEAEAILRGSFDELEFVIMESFPPIGRAFLGVTGPDDCLVVADLLEAQSYVDSATCEVSDTGSNDGDEDVPVVNPALPE